MRWSALAAAAALLAAPAAYAHEHPGKHASSEEECKTIAGKKQGEMKKCVACVKQAGHHYHVGKVKGDRCHDDNSDPMEKKK